MKKIRVKGVGMKRYIRYIKQIALLVLAILPAIYGIESFESVKQNLDKAIALVGKDIEKNDLKVQLAVLIKDQDKHPVISNTLSSIRRDAFKGLLAAFSDTCIPAGSAKERLKDRLRLLETSLSVYAGFLSRLTQKIKDATNASDFKAKLVLVDHELQEVLYWKEFIRESLSNTTIASNNK